MSPSRLRTTVASFALCLLVATAASAALSKPYQEWREGPAQWIMTSEEQRAWRSVKTDQQAIDFIDLFWARRDPTPGTAENEFRNEFHVRVNSADQQFADKGRRGSMTDRGRVAIVLGPPSRGGNEAGYTASSANAGGSFGNTSGRQAGARAEWEWDYAAAQKFGMPKALVVFIQDPTTGRFRRDVQRTDFITASANAIKRAVVNDLNEIPSWAARGGLEPRDPQQAAAAPAATTRPAPAQSGKIVSTTTVNFPEEQFIAKGVSRLTLARNVFDVDPQTKTDPFTTLSAAEAFRASEELGWAARYCTASNDEPNVTFTVRLTGTAAGEVIDRAAEPEEIVPDRIRALNGCYMLRGSIPLEGMSAGDYQLEVTVADPATNKDAVLKKTFRIE
ncbi:MAG TPA: GWxTD domain-containing protein [Thermoanaerobaculia bacterium]|nr:GWxTD domain-containing protein [Thermoanaerobaculia bacterium]